MVTSAGQEINTFITDHLGSVRAIRNSAGNIEAVAEYYPYGLKWSGAGLMASTNRWLYNGKELQNAPGLDLLDYGFRMYDPYTIKWNGIDRYSEYYYEVTPYGYCGGNPIYNVDVNGEFISAGVGFIIGGIVGGVKAHKQGGNFWTGAVEGAVAGAVTGLAIDAAVAMVATTVATGGAAGVVAGVVFTTSAGAIGGAMGGVLGDIAGQITTNITDGNMGIVEAVTSINGDNMLYKMEQGTISGMVGGAAGGATAAFGQVATGSTKAVQSTMSRNITSAAETLQSMGASEATISNAVNKIATGMGNAGISTANQNAAVGLSSAVGTQLGQELIVQPLQPITNYDQQLLIK